MVILTSVYVICTIGILCVMIWSAKGVRDQANKARQTGIRPLVIGTRLSAKGEIGVHAGQEGRNSEIRLMNIGLGLAHRANIRVSPPAEAYTTSQDTPDEKIHVIHQMEIPVGTKRTWNYRGAFCNKDDWHCMYAEYEDLEGNQYYTVQSGYSVKTGELSDLGRVRKPDDDAFWDQKEINLPAELDYDLRQWVARQEQIYSDRIKNPNSWMCPSNLKKANNQNMATDESSHA